MLPILEEIVSDAGGETLAELGIDVSFDFDKPELLKWLKEKTIQFADATWDTSAATRTS
jgi:hypothetical protein